jgi:hypothetical protein
MSLNRRTPGFLNQDSGLLPLNRAGAGHAWASERASIPVPRTLLPPSRGVPQRGAHLPSHINPSSKRRKG